MRMMSPSGGTNKRSKNHHTGLRLIQDRSQPPETCRAQSRSPAQCEEVRLCAACQRPPLGFRGADIRQAKTGRVRSGN